MLGLPQTQRGSDSIFMVVDCFFKMTHFISGKRITNVSHKTLLFFWEVYPIHGLPFSIVSDHDTQFRSHVYEG